MGFDVENGLEVFSDVTPAEAVALFPDGETFLTARDGVFAYRIHRGILSKPVKLFSSRSYVSALAINPVSGEFAFGCISFFLFCANCTRV
jgi:hypothetical protein